MERADDRVLSALASLQGNADWAVVREWMTKSKTKEMNTLLLTKDEVQTRWLQGSLQVLTEILDLSDKAMGLLHRKV